MRDRAASFKNKIEKPLSSKHKRTEIGPSSRNDRRLIFCVDVSNLSIFPREAAEICVAHGVCYLAK